MTSTQPTSARYEQGTGMRLTDCCGAYSTYSGAELCCKACWEEVEDGQGDGTEYHKAA